MNIKISKKSWTEYVKWCSKHPYVDYMEYVGPITDPRKPSESEYWLWYEEQQQAKAVKRLPYVEKLILKRQDLLRQGYNAWGPAKATWAKVDLLNELIAELRADATTQLKPNDRKP